MLEPWYPPPSGLRPCKSESSSPFKPSSRPRLESFHVTHKIPCGDTPYVKAKQVQLVDKNPEKAVALFWAAINAGDRVDSALKDMAIVMKQQNRAEEAIEAIKSLRHRCSDQAQESLDNILLDLYKRCGRIEDQISLLKHKLHLIQQGLAFNGKRTKTARSQGKKFQVSVGQETTRLLGNLGWAFMQQQNYIEAEEAYREALSICSDSNKMCNLGICLMKQGRIAEAKESLRQVRPADADGPRGMDSHLKAFERAQEMLRELESDMMKKKLKQDQLFEAFLGSSIWQPLPCSEALSAQNSWYPEEPSADDNFQPGRGSCGFKHEQIPSASINQAAVKWMDSSCFPASSKPHVGLKKEGFVQNSINNMPADEWGMLYPHPLQTSKYSNHSRNSLNSEAPPFYSRSGREAAVQSPLQDPFSNLKRSRSGSLTGTTALNPVLVADKMEGTRRSEEEASDHWLNVLPDAKEFDEAIVAAILAPFKEKGAEDSNNNKKRFKVFQDITPSLSSRA